MAAKRIFYIIFTILLGILLSYLFHAAIEISYLDHADQVIWYKHFGIGECALHPIIQYGLLLIGTVGGYSLGKYWWDIVYVEKRHWRFKKNK